MLRETIEYVPVDLIDCETQVRTQVTEESLIPLGRAIQEAQGVLQPIRVRRQGCRFVVVDGERRLLAARLVKLAEIPAIVDDRPLSTGDVLQQQLILNLQRAELSPVERASAIQRLLDVTKWSAAEAAGKLGLSKATVSRLLSLLSLPEDIRRDIDAGKIPMSAGPQLAHITEPEQKALASRLTEGSLTRDGLASAMATEPKQSTEDEPAPAKRIKFNLGNGESVTVVARTLDTLIENLRRIAAAGRKTLGQGGDLETLRRSQKSI